MHQRTEDRDAELERATRFADRIDLYDIAERCGCAVASRLFVAACRSKHYVVPNSLWALRYIVGSYHAPMVAEEFGGRTLDGSRRYDDLEQIYARAIRADRIAGMTLPQILRKHRIEGSAQANPVDINFVQRVLGIKREEG